jgi:hypothetical protein
MVNATLINNQIVAVQKLEKRGFSRAEAEGIVEALSDNAVELATKADLKDEVRNLELRLYKYFGAILIAHGLGTAALTVALLQLLR